VRFVFQPGPPRATSSSASQRRDSSSGAPMPIAGSRTFTSRVADASRCSAPWRRSAACCWRDSRGCRASRSRGCTTIWGRCSSEWTPARRSVLAGDTFPARTDRRCGGRSTTGAASFCDATRNIAGNVSCTGLIHRSPQLSASACEMAALQGATAFGTAPSGLARAAQSLPGFFKTCFS